MNAMLQTSSTLEDVFDRWSKPLTDAQQDKCDRAVREITQAVQTDSKLGPMMTAGWISTFPQGSYANNVNVREESDVDVCVLCSKTFMWEPHSLTLDDIYASPATYDFATFKNDLQRALTNYFGPSAVTRGNKAFDVKETHLRVEADAAPCFQYRRYYRDLAGRLEFHAGTALLPDAGVPWVYNFPAQQKLEGEAKNRRTNWRYKKAVRILKKTRYCMIADGLWDEDRAPSFLLESALWNQADAAYAGSLLVPMIKLLLGLIYESCGPGGDALSWYESNAVKGLFTEGQNWSPQDLRDFASAAWRYLDLDNA